MQPVDNLRGRAAEGEADQVANVFEAPALLVIMRWLHTYRSSTSRANRPID